MLKYIKGMHRHHIVPRHAGGTDDDSNMVYLTKEEHIAAHQKRYDELGEEADRRAVLILRHSVSDLAELAMWRHENAKKIALLAHNAKMKNGFYRRLGELNSARLKGLPQPEKVAQMSAATKGTQWYNDGTMSKRLRECPAGWVEGRLFKHTAENKKIVSEKIAAMKWWNDGTCNRRNATCPGDCWKPGRINQGKINID